MHLKIAFKNCQSFDFDVVCILGQLKLSVGLASCLTACLLLYYLAGKNKKKVSQSPLCLSSLQLLSKPKFSVLEKIKTIGSTYMVAAGLQPGKEGERSVTRSISYNTKNWEIFLIKIIIRASVLF